MELVKKKLEAGPKSLVESKILFLEPKQTITVETEVGKKAIE